MIVDESWQYEAPKDEDEMTGPIRNDAARH
jgi:hypothetical protein